MVKKYEINGRNGCAWVDVLRGRVTNQSEQRWSETHVHGGGGGGHINRGYGYIAPTQVSSSASEQHLNQFWVRGLEDTETHFQVRNKSFAVAPGHEVIVAWGAAKGRDEGDLLFAANLTSNTTVDLLGEGRGWYNWAEDNKLVTTPVLYTGLFTWLPRVITILIITALPQIYFADPATHRWFATADAETSSAIREFEASRYLAVGRWISGWRLADEFFVDSSVFRLHKGHQQQLLGLRPAAGEQIAKDDARFVTELRKQFKEKLQGSAWLHIPVIVIAMFFLAIIWRRIGWDVYLKNWRSKQAQKIRSQVHEVFTRRT